MWFTYSAIHCNIEECLTRLYSLRRCHHLFTNFANLKTNVAYNPAHFKWLMAALFFILFFKLGTAPIYILDEAKNAQCAREMLQKNDWIVPTFNGELRTDKPVLHYYFMMLAYKVFGVSEFAARFFSALLGCFTVFLTFRFARRFINSLAAFFAALVLFASTQFLFEFRLSVPDPYLIFFIAAGLFTAFTYLQEGKLKWLLIAAVCFSMAALAKGPVALALPGLCLLIWVMFKKKWRLLFSWKILAAIALVAVITLPWYLAVDKATDGAWTRGFFIEHNLNRFSDPQEGHGGLFILTLAFALIGLLPFTSFVAEVAKNRKQVFANDLVKFSGIVVLAFITFFSVASTKLPNYAMPCYPFVAIILGHYLSRLAAVENGFKKYPVIILTILTLIIPAGGYFALAAEKEVAHLRWLPLILLTAAIAFILLLTTFKNLSNYKRILAIAGAFSVLNVMALHIVYPIIYLQNPVAKTIAEVKKHSTVFSYKLYNPGFNFYLDNNVKKFFNADTLLQAINSQPDAVVISRLENDAELKTLNLTLIAQHHDLFESPTTVLYVINNKP